MTLLQSLNCLELCKLYIQQSNAANLSSSVLLKNILLIVSFVREDF